VKEIQTPPPSKPEQTTFLQITTIFSMRKYVAVPFKKVKLKICDATLAFLSAASNLFGWRCHFRRFVECGLFFCIFLCGFKFHGRVGASKFPGHFTLQFVEAPISTAESGSHCVAMRVKLWIMYPVILTYYNDTLVRGKWMDPLFHDKWCRSRKFQQHWFLIATK